MTASNGHVLLMGGTSGSGKTTAAKRLARRTNTSWVQVDDIRLAFQWSRVRLPTEEATQALYALDQANAWSQPVAALCEIMIQTGEGLADAIAIITANHVAQGDSAIIEGDGILPTIVDHPQIRPLIASGLVHIVFVLPDSRDEITHRLRDRGRDASQGNDDVVIRNCEMHWQFTRWLRERATEWSLPILSPSPLDTLADRILHKWPLTRDAHGETGT